MSRLYSILLIANFVLLTASSFGAVIRVKPGNKIQVSIKNAVAGDTILIAKGIYKEHDIHVNKRLVIIGEQYPVIDGENKYQLFIVTADSVTIQGLQIQNTGKSSLTDMAAIRIQKAAYSTIENNRLLNNTYGIYIQNSHHCHAINNILQSHAEGEQNSGNGIHAWKAEHLLVKGNNISGHRDGIYFEFVTESEIINNTSSSNVRYGLHFMFSHNDSYVRNTFSGNGAGVAVMFSRKVSMRKNIFKNNWGDASYGLLLKEITDGTISDNLFIKNTVGIYMEGAVRIDAQRNTFKSNGWAIRMQASCSDGTFTSNNFLSNSFDVATNGTMMLNVFNKNYWDKYDGYDIDRNKIGDVPYYPVSIYAIVSEKIPVAMILYRSLLTDLMDKVEKVLPSIIPDQLKDDEPLMKKWEYK